MPKRDKKSESRLDLDLMTDEDHEFLHAFLEEHPEFRAVDLSDCYFKAKAVLQALPPERMDQAREWERFIALSLKIARPRIPDDDTDWVSKLLEIDKDASEGMRKWLEDPAHAHIAKLPFAEAGVWLQAMHEDLAADIQRQEQERTQLYRENGFVALADARMFGRVWKGLKAAKSTPVWKLMEFLRMQKRLSRTQRQALHIWDRYYATKGLAFPSDEDVDRLEAELDARWDRQGVRRVG